ncbi:hypothetical protein [Chryseobacterium nepalense]|uniref:hypothetical protein n=1 Tax=Chryseobacterium nepalense TaxID=1854498 RepID=UPI002E03C185|nr:hypothetical protein [Chryseobacterium nepalense]
MSPYLKILCVLFGFMLFYKANAQLDTLQILKKIEANQKHYRGKPFSKLLKDLKKLYPEKYYTTYRCLYQTQFFLPTHENKDKNKYKMTITWDYSMLYKTEILENTDRLNGFDKGAEMTYKTIIIKNIKISYNEGLYVMSCGGGTPKKYKNPYVYLNGDLEREKGLMYGEPFHYFICWLQRHYMRILKVENIIDKNNPNKISESIFRIKNSFDKTAKVVVNGSIHLLENK